MLRLLMAFGLLVSFTSFAAVFAAQPPIRVAPIQRAISRDAGCALVAKGAGYDTMPLFMDVAGSKPTMNINGQDVTLTRDENFYEKNKAHYTAGDFDVLVNYGRGKEGEGGASYKNARIIVTRGTEKTVVKAEGSCGC